jgi:CDP-glucose 4,6-dehydratase
VNYFINRKFWKNKKVFVTGHTGFKGSWLCIYLNLLGAKVTGYSLKPSTSPNLFNQANISNLIHRSIIADIRNYKKFYSELKKSKATILFHLAAQPIVRRSYEAPMETFDTNFNGALNVLESIREIKDIKTSILITSDKVYDISKNKIFKETDKLFGIDPYSSSKACIELMFSSYIDSFFSKQSKQMLATVRAGNVIGGGDYSKFRIIPDIFRYNENKKNIVIRYPKAVRPWQHVLEPLTGYIMLAQNLHDKKMKKLTQNWNFGPDVVNCKTVNHIAKYFADRLNLKVIHKLEKKDQSKKETNILRLNNSKAKKFIKWIPKWKLNKSLDMILEWNKRIKNESCLDVCRAQIKEYLNH